MALNENIPPIKIMGFKSDINDVMATINLINKLSKDSRCVVQLMDARGVAGQKHVLHATIHAINAFKRKNNISNDLGMEICVRVSAQRQISKAIKILGLKEGLKEICAVIVEFNQDSDMGIAENELNNIFLKDDTVLEPDDAVLKDIYGIKNEEIDMGKGLLYTLLERTTLLILDA